MDSKLGSLIRVHQENGYEDIGKIVGLDRAADQYWWIPIREKKQDGSTRHFIKAPRCGNWSKLIESENISLIDYIPPAAHLATEDELRSRSYQPVLGRVARQNTADWINRCDAKAVWINDLFEKYSIVEILRSKGHVSRWAKDRAKTLGHKDSTKVVRAIRERLWGAGDPMAHLPDFANCGGPGKPKFSSFKTGKPNKPSKQDQAFRGYICSKQDRDKLHRGWARYKIKKTSVENAYIRTMEEYYAKSRQCISSTEYVVELLPIHERPTLAEFKRHGPASVADTAQRINLGTHRYDRDSRPLNGSSKDQIRAAGQLAWLDSTCDDQTLVSHSSRLLALSSPWRTILHEGYTEAVIGFYCGFENSSTMTSLLALLSCAEGVKRTCELYGVPYVEDEWVTLMPKRVRGDNGDLKSATGIRQASAAEITAEFVASYASERKGPVEAGHKSLHRLGGHEVPGSTQGQQRQRGDPHREDSACYNFSEYMPVLLNSIIYYNNIQEVPHLLTLEMRRDDVKPTRIAILRWLIKNHYVSSEPYQLDQMRAHCFPTLKASMERGVIRVFDPRSRQPRLIPNLRYRSTSLSTSDFVMRASGKKRTELNIHLNPSNLGEAWIRLGSEMALLSLMNTDPEMPLVTLFDWLRITDEDKLRSFLDRSHRENKKASNLAYIDNTTASAKKVKKQERAAHPSPPTKSQMRLDKTINTQKELDMEHLKKLGLQDLSPHHSLPHVLQWSYASESETSWEEEQD